MADYARLLYEVPLSDNLIHEPEPCCLCVLASRCLQTADRSDCSVRWSHSDSAFDEDNRPHFARSEGFGTPNLLIRSDPD
jgi:hypothetical protein